MQTRSKKEAGKKKAAGKEKDLWHAMSGKVVLEKLKIKKDVLENGLSDYEAAQRLQKYGFNKLEEKRKIRPFMIFLQQFNSFLVYILVIAAVISALIKHWLDFYVICAIVLLNSTISFVQQHKAEQSIKKLRKMLVPKVKVMRDGKLKTINSIDIVPGDVLVFNEGDKVVADCRLILSENLQTNEAVLTGESMPVGKQARILKEKTGLYERKNILYAGTSVVRGNGKAVVVSTGVNTQFGKIAHLLQQVKVEKTPMQKRLDVFAKHIGIIVIILVAIIALITLLVGFDKSQTFLIAVALAVSAIPEGLPAVITICLAIATRRMFNSKTLVRRLPAAETLGSTTVICVDKTGTITEEKMTATHIYSGRNFFIKTGENLIKLAEKKNKLVKIEKEKDVKQLFKISILCNNARLEKFEKAKGMKGIDSKLIKKYNIIGDPTETALVAAAFDFGFDKQKFTRVEPRIKEFSFTSERKIMSIIRRQKFNKISYVKGATEKIIRNCRYELLKGRIVELDEKRKKELLGVAKNMEADALRVLGFGFRYVNRNLELENIKEKDAETGLIFSGLIGMSDPPRPEVRDAIKKCIDAGIKVKMITGDAAITAGVIAKQIGLQGKIITGKKLDEFDDKKLYKVIDEIAIFARTTPQQKLRIITILKRKNEIVAVTGDGVNDVLALKRADIGVAMGLRGSDVARDVSDIVLLDDNFASIVNATEQGRIVYDNTKKFTKYLLSVNFSELMLILYAIIIRSPLLPLLPLQILWINLVTDSIPALALGAEKGEDVMKTGPRKGKNILKDMIYFLIFAGIFAFLVEILIFHFAISSYGVETALSKNKIRTMVMTTAIMFELFFVFVCRSEKSIFKIGSNDIKGIKIKERLKQGLFSNKWLVWAFIAAMVLQLIAIYTPLGIAFSLVPLTAKEWLIILPFALSGFVVFEVVKIFKRKSWKKEEEKR